MWTSDVALISSWWRTIVGCLFGYRVITKENKHNSGPGVQIIQTYNIWKKALLILINMWMKDWHQPFLSPCTPALCHSTLWAEYTSLPLDLAIWLVLAQAMKQKWSFASLKPSIQKVLSVSTCSLFPREWYAWACLLVPREGWQALAAELSPSQDQLSRHLADQQTWET